MKNLKKKLEFMNPVNHPHFQNDWFELLNVNRWWPITSHVDETEMMHIHTICACTYIKSNTTDATSRVRVTRSLVLCVCFVDRSLSFCTFCFGHCVVCSSSIYGFRLPLWYLQTLLEKELLTLPGHLSSSPFFTCLSEGLCCLLSSCF